MLAYPKAYTQRKIHKSDCLLSPGNIKLLSQTVHIDSYIRLLCHCACASLWGVGPRSSYSKTFSPSAAQGEDLSLLLRGVPVGEGKSVSVVPPARPRPSSHS